MGGEEEWEGGPQLECKMKFFKEKEKKGGEAQPQVRTCVVVQALISSMGAAEERPARSPQFQRSQGLHCNTLFQNTRQNETKQKQQESWVKCIEKSD